MSLFINTKPDNILGRVFVTTETANKIKDMQVSSCECDCLSLFAVWSTARKPRVFCCLLPSACWDSPRNKHLWKIMEWMFLILKNQPQPQHMDLLTQNQLQLLLLCFLRNKIVTGQTGNHLLTCRELSVTKSILIFTSSLDLSRLAE